MTIALTTLQRDVLVAMIERGVADVDSVTPHDRRRWLGQVTSTRVVGHCSCGTCPSVELGDALGASPRMDRSRVVLTAGSPGALLLLFVDDDLPSYLELAPTEDDGSFDEFPPVDQISFA